MRWEPAKNGVGVVKILEVTHCASCGREFVPGRFYTSSWRQCGCTDGEQGHVDHGCLHPDCRTLTPEPPCYGQYGATADYGVSTHRPISGPGRR